MRVSDPVPWSYIPPGAVVLDATGVDLYGNVVTLTEQPRTVLSNVPAPLGCRAILLEGCAPLTARPADTARLVTLGMAEALGHLRGAGLTTEIIEIQE